MQFVCAGIFTAQSTRRSCQASQLIVALFLGRLRSSKRLTSTKQGRPWQLGLTAETTLFQSCSAVSQKTGHQKGNWHQLPTPSDDGRSPETLLTYLCIYPEETPTILPSLSWRAANTWGFCIS